MKEGVKLLAGVSAGFYLFWLTSHPRSSVHKKLPEKRIKNFTVFPHVKLHRKNKVVHMHHWLLLSLFYFQARRKRLIKSKLAHGFLLGSILQGLLYKDRFRIVYNSSSMVRTEDER